MKILQICPPYLSDVTTLPCENSKKDIFNSIIDTYLEINTKKLQFIHSVNGDKSKTAKNINMVILPTITSPGCQRDAE